MRGDIFDDDALAGKRRRSAGTGCGADFHPVDRGVEGVGQAWGGAGGEALAIVVDQQNAAQHSRIEFLDALRQRFKNAA
jgi:hypothetical protein